MIPVIDLFAGCGGLGEGFASLLVNQNSVYSIPVSVEYDPAACASLRLRKFYRSFSNAPEDYYQYLRGEISLDVLSGRFPKEWDKAHSEVFQEELGDNEFTDNGLHDLVRAATKGHKHWVLVGGPPCQAYSSSGRSRNKAVKGYKAEEDVRHFLYQQYLKVIAEHAPSVFLMENVPGILSSRVQGELMFPKILRDLENPAEALALGAEHPNAGLGYKIYSLVTPTKFDMFHDIANKPSDFIVDADDYGVPQSRSRVFLLGVKLGLKGTPTQLIKSAGKVTVRSVIKDLPRIRSVLSKDDSKEAWLKAVSGQANKAWLSELREQGRTELVDNIEDVVENIKIPKAGSGSSFVKSKGKGPAVLNNWYFDERIGGVCNHESRGHMASDLQRYLFCASEMSLREAKFEEGKLPEVSAVKLHDYPTTLLPDHRNVKESTNLKKTAFSDRFKVQRAGAPSTTVVSHIRQDGHYYIHYDASQCRSLTLREAARLQTFPDNFFFEGSRGDGYQQIGNAVPPLLAKQIAEVIHDFLSAQ
jgi:DNA (cytosine-5)-methyltransferase 1